MENGDVEFMNMVKYHYNNHLNSRNDIRASLTFTKQIGFIPNRKQVDAALKLVNDEIEKRYYGTLLTIPEFICGARILDLGCGAGRDSFVISKLVGPTGFVVGIDFATTLIKIANENIPYHMEIFGFDKPNIAFHNCAVQDLESVGIQKESFDIVISNNVFSLCPDKFPVFKAAYDALKTGGELYCTDLYPEKTLPAELRSNELLCSEGYFGLTWPELNNIAELCRFTRPILCQCCILPDTDEEILRLIGSLRVMTATTRMFKLDKLSTKNTIVRYIGNIPDFEDEFVLNWKTKFSKDENVAVDKELATILLGSRFKNCFEIVEPSLDITEVKRLEGNDTDPFELMDYFSRDLV